jgi:hypothetical protein
MENAALASIYCGGVLSLLMAVYHTRFYKMFKWEDEFRRIRELNSDIIYTIHIALLLLFFGFSFLTLIFAHELASCTGIALGINLLLSSFWVWRMVWQVIYFRPGGRLRFLIIHYTLTVYFCLLAASYLLPVVLKLF